MSFMADYGDDGEPEISEVRLFAQRWVVVGLFVLAMLIVKVLA